MRGLNVMDALVVELGSGDISLIDVDASDAAHLTSVTGEGNVLVLTRRQLEVNYANYDILVPKCSKSWNNIWSVWWDSKYERMDGYCEY